MNEVNEEVRGKDLISARECILSQYDAILKALLETLRNHTVGEPLTFSLLSDDLNFAPFAPNIKNTQTEEAMAADLSKVLARDPKLSPEYIQSIFGDYTKWNDLVLKNMLPVWVLVSNGNRCARAFANCVTVLGFFSDGIEINYPEKPAITFEKGWPQVTLSPDFVTLLRFNIEQRTNLDAVRSALFSRDDNAIPVPQHFADTFKAEDANLARTNFSRYLALRFHWHKHVKVTEAQLMKQRGTFKKWVSDADFQRVRLAGVVGLPASDMLKKIAVENAQKKGQQLR